MADALMSALKISRCNQLLTLEKNQIQGKQLSLSNWTVMSPYFCSFPILVTQLPNILQLSLTESLPAFSSRLPSYTLMKLSMSTIGSAKSILKLRNYMTSLEAMFSICWPIHTPKYKLSFGNFKLLCETMVILLEGGFLPDILLNQ